MRDMKIIIVIFLFIHAIKCTKGSQKFGGRIVGGKLANRDQFPYMVGIDSFNQNNHVTSSFCGGTLISNSWVLTAAHCVYGKEYHLVYLGSIFLDESDIAYKVFSDKVSVHYRFNLISQANDIALIQIPETPFCDGIFPAKLPGFTNMYETFEGHYALAMGWGRISTSGPMTDRLRFINRSILSNEFCEQYRYPLYPEHLCFNASISESTCLGDSGGPLVLDSTQELVGIAVGVHADGCETGTPNFFIRVTEYLYWIRGITGISYIF